MNEGYFAEQGKWMYFTLPSTSNKMYPIYRVMKDGETGLKAITDPGNMNFINVIGNWVYYIGGNGTNYHFIYRAKTNGSVPEQVLNGYVLYI